MKIQYTSFSETGLIRKENQDALFCGTDHGAGLFVVADGMGGCQDGGGASTIIKEKAAHWWSRYKHSVKPPDFLTAVRELQEVFAEANGTIYSGTESGASCGSTLVALWLEQDDWAVISCGDSRCYQAKAGIFGNKLVQLTMDDVWENQLSNVQGMTREQIETDQKFGFLVRAVGVEPEFQCSVQCGQCKGKNMFILCSDGIYKYCSEEVIKKLSLSAMKSKKLDLMSQGIWRQVLKNGAGDNLSLVLVLAEN